MKPDQDILKHLEPEHFFMTRDELLNELASSMETIHQLAESRWDARERLTGENQHMRQWIDQAVVRLDEAEQVVSKCKRQIATMQGLIGMWRLTSYALAILLGLIAAYIWN